MGLFGQTITNAFLNPVPAVPALGQRVSGLEASGSTLLFHEASMRLS